MLVKWTELNSFRERKALMTFALPFPQWAARWFPINIHSLGQLNQGLFWVEKVWKPIRSDFYQPIKDTQSRMLGIFQSTFLVNTLHVQSIEKSLAEKAKHCKCKKVVAQQWPEVQQMEQNWVVVMSINLVTIFTGKATPKIAMRQSGPKRSFYRELKHP